MKLDTGGIKATNLGANMCNHVREMRVRICYWIVWNVLLFDLPFYGFKSFAVADFRNRLWLLRTNSFSASCEPVRTIKN